MRTSPAGGPTAVANVGGRREEVDGDDGPLLGLQTRHRRGLVRPPPHHLRLRVRLSHSCSPAHTFRHDTTRHAPQDTTRPDWGTVVGDEGPAHAGEEVVVAALGLGAELDVERGLAVERDGEVVVLCPASAGRLAHVARRKRQQHHAWHITRHLQHDTRDTRHDTRHATHDDTRTAAGVDEVGHVVADRGTDRLVTASLVVARRLCSFKKQKS